MHVGNGNGTGASERDKKDESEDIKGDGRVKELKAQKYALLRN
mgnify:CR=1 FL=1